MTLTKLFAEETLDKLTIDNIKREKKDSILRLDFSTSLNTFNPINIRSSLPIQEHIVFSPSIQHKVAIRIREKFHLGIGYSYGSFKQENEYTFQEMYAYGAYGLVAQQKGGFNSKSLEVGYEILQRRNFKIITGLLFCNNTFSRIDSKYIFLTANGSIIDNEFYRAKYKNHYNNNSINAKFEMNYSLSSKWNIMASTEIWILNRNNVNVPVENFKYKAMILCNRIGIIYNLGCNLKNNRL